MTDREEFEAWAKTMNMDLTPFEETFDSDFTSNAWDGWHAARATAEQSTFALQALVAAGHVSQAKVDEALSIAGKTPGIRAAEQNQSDAWKEYAQHLEHCRQCGEMSYTDCDEGTRLHDDANSIESQQDVAIESKPTYEDGYRDAWSEACPNCGHVKGEQLDSGEAK